MGKNYIRKRTHCKFCQGPLGSLEANCKRRGQHYVYCSDRCLIEGRRAYYREYSRAKFTKVRGPNASS